MRTAVRVLAPLLALSALGALSLTLQEQGFPHREHDGLFPLCQSCHSGIETSAPEDDFPDPARCAACHDGDRAFRVEWSGRTPRPSNLAFSHQAHSSRLLATGGSADCGTCHRAAGAEAFMAVERASPERCLSCHEHRADEHLEEGRDCLSCHVPLADASALPLSRLRDFPSPATHGAPDFGAAHALLAEAGASACAVCHTRDSCTRCHMNGDELPSIRSLAGDARVSVLEAGRLPAYPEPASHHDFAWSWGHGEVAAERPGYCGNCHAQESCASCHVTYAGEVVDQLPALERGDGRGVRVDESMGVHDPGFAITHASRGALDDGTCRSCHSTSFCESCHDGPTQPAFHFGNYLQLHGAEAWGSEFECATCHNPEVFCRGCHESAGRGSEGRLDVAYHSRSPFWLFAHGNAARQSLETCATCHSQSDCTICHAAVGSWRINPHGPGFDAARLRDANVWSCLACHRNGIPPT